MAGIFIVAVLAGVGLGASSAIATDSGSAPTPGGFGAAAMSSDPIDSRGSDVDFYGGEVCRERSALASPCTRTLEANLSMLDERDRIASEKAAREDATVLERVAAQKAMQGVSSSGESIEYDLPAVNWEVGREAFVQEWSARIDSYLKGSNLEGYGRTFAEAAWVNGIDPRWSPAISNTESGKGKACFLPHNAWGWGSSSWSDWESAIRAHAKGLAEVYGYSLTLEAAGIYCPPNQAGWYATTFAQMEMI